LFGAISFIWSDYPFVSLKRWIKAIGTVIMVLVVLTEQRPYIAMGTIFKRLSFLLMPLSVLFIKYYPHLGRDYHMGQPMFTGVANQKNGLGMLCLIIIIYFSWNFLIAGKEKLLNEYRLHYSIYFFIMPMVVWLLYMANSATSTACVLVGIGLFSILRLRIFDRQPLRIFVFLTGIVLFFISAELMFNIKDMIISLLGRRPDLTTRGPMWESLLSININPIVGTGFESFWLGERREYIRTVLGIPQHQAHNGYLEMYLHLGFFGVAFIFGWFFSGLKKIYHRVKTDYSTTIFRLVIIVVVYLYNYTEATFLGTSNMWFLLFFAVIDKPSTKQIEYAINPAIKNINYAA